MSRIYLFFEETAKPGMPEIPARRARLAEIAHPEERARYRASSRALFRAAAFFGLDSANFFYEAGGRPVLPGAWVSLSHGGNLAVCAISRGKVGVDLERSERQIPLRLLCRVGAQDGLGETNLEKWLAYEARRKAAGPERVGFLTRGAYRVAVCAEETDAIYDGDTGEKL